jgi:hypothetical protein
MRLAHSNFEPCRPREKVRLNNTVAYAGTVRSFQGDEVGAFKPGQYVPKSGVYSVHHKAHRLMHQVTLLADQRFPCCRQCENQVRFELHRSTRGGEGFAFHSGELLIEYPAAVSKPRKLAG